MTDTMCCAACGERTGIPTCERCGQDARLDGRYALLDVLGRGAQGTTWLATTADGVRVAVKELPLHGDDKARELVDREARVLREIAVPGVPRYVDHFTARSGRHRSACVVQEYVPGPTLAAHCATRRLTEAEAIAYVDALLGVLAGLHALAPPVVHRDVKPANVILRDGTEVTLVDFGSVGDAWKGTLGGSTVTGTFGYMAPEQFAGDASPASDVYAAAATLVALLSRKEPASMQAADRTIAWRSHMQVGPTLSDWLDHCLAATPADRPRNAAIARAELGTATAIGTPRSEERPTSNALPLREADRLDEDDLFSHLPSAEVGSSAIDRVLRWRSGPSTPKIIAVVLTIGFVVFGALLLYVPFWFAPAPTPVSPWHTTLGVDTPEYRLGERVHEAARHCFDDGEMWQGEIVAFSGAVTANGGPDDTIARCVATAAATVPWDGGEAGVAVLMTRDSLTDVAKALTMEVVTTLPERSSRGGSRTPHTRLTIVGAAGHAIAVRGNGIDLAVVEDLAGMDVPSGDYTLVVDGQERHIVMIGAACTVTLDEAGASEVTCG